MVQTLEADEALDILSSRRGASSAEIKEAYRDLVKVWHPDRFGSDARLRGKAEAKLQQINEAYRVLQRVPLMEDVDPPGAARAAMGDDLPPRYSVPARRRRRRRARSKKSPVGMGWMLGALGVWLVFVAGYFLEERELKQDAGPSPALAQPAGEMSGRGGAEIPSGEAAGGEQGKGAAPRTLTGRKVEAKEAGGPDDAGGGQVRAWPLTDAQTEEIEGACLRVREARGAAGYLECMKAQLELITHPAREPDLHGLRAGERESIESVCSHAERARGRDGYNRCLSVQMARLAAEPARPDLSGVGEADRDAMELACRNAKHREGPAAYDRCLVRAVKLLADSR